MNPSWGLVWSAFKGSCGVPLEDWVWGLPWWLDVKNQTWKWMAVSAVCAGSASGHQLLPLVKLEHKKMPPIFMWWVPHQTMTLMMSVNPKQMFICIFDENNHFVFHLKSRCKPTLFTKKLHIHWKEAQTTNMIWKQVAEREGFVQLVFFCILSDDNNEIMSNKIHKSFPASSWQVFQSLHKRKSCHLLMFSFQKIMFIFELSLCGWCVFLSDLCV